jgi:PAS domain S-box-containing protein
MDNEPASPGNTNTDFLTLEGIPDGVVTLDREWRYTYVNAAAERLLGRSRSEMLGRTLWEMFPNVAGSEIEVLFRRVAVERCTLEFEGRSEALDMWCDNRIYPIPDGGVAVYFRDITDRRRAEAAHRESEERFAKFMRHLPGLAWIKDLAGAYVFANDAAVRAFGTTRTRLYGHTDHDIFPSDVAAQFRSNDMRAAESEWGIQTIETLEQDDGLHYSVVSKFPIPGPDGATALVGGMAIDITEGRETEEAFRKQTDRLRLLWESASILLTTDDPDAMMKGLFGKISSHFGVDAYFNYMVDESGEALRLASCVGVPEGALERMRTLSFGEALCGRVAVNRAPLVATFIQDSEDPNAQLVKSFGIRAYACNPLMADGRLLGTLSFASHTRDQFDSDELEFLRTITHYVTVAYERMRLVRELRENDRRKDEFLATLAHELRNPLAPLRSGLELLNLIGGEDPDVVEIRAMMERQLGQMVRLIDDLLDVSRISRDRVELRRERAALAAIVRNAVETSRPLIEGSGHTLEITGIDDPVLVDGDVTRLAQVFANLLNNAAKYTERGGRIGLAIRRAGGDVIVEVTDSGMGIPRAMLSRVFDMFTQVDTSLERAHGGLGIGLTIVRRLVEMHGGAVEARSDGLGRGSTFSVRLPVAVGDLAEVETRPPSSSPAARRILVVDDNRDSAVTLAMVLRRMGNHVEAVHDGREAIARAETYRPDLILLDIGMPGMSGYDVARRIRSAPWGKSLTLIALTGWGQEDDRRRSREAGFDHHLLKPVETSMLEQLLR